MQAMSNNEFLEIEGLVDGENWVCRSCGGMLDEAERKNTTPEGEELPRFICSLCGEVYEQTDDEGVGLL